LVQASCERTHQNRPSIGLVLGGGGARGGAHIGVIRVLEEMHIPVDYIAGTSIGSLVGALYAMGMDADELEELVGNLDWDDLFNDETERQNQSIRRKSDDTKSLYGPKLGVGKGSQLVQRGAITGQKINFLFETLVKQRSQVSRFDDLPIPYRAVATDLVTGQAVILSEGDLALAMKASMSVPGIFSPVVLGDQLLVDGGIANNVPIDVVRAMGADIVIAVNVGTGLSAREDLSSMLAVVGQLTNILTNSNTERNIATLSKQDILITPPLGNVVTSASFDKTALGIVIGYDAALEERGELQRLSLSADEYRAYHAALERCVSSPGAIRFIRLENKSRFSDRVILNRVSLEVGDDLDIDTLDANIRDIYGLGFLESARYELVEENGETGVVLHVQQDVRGTQFIETGLSYSADGSTSDINLRIGYLNAALDQFGSEFRVLAQVGADPGLLVEVNKYLDSELRWFARPQLFAQRYSLTAFDTDGDALYTNWVDRYGGSLGIGREIGHHAALVAGINLYSGEVEVAIGPPNIKRRPFEVGEYYISGIFDRLDDRYFPGQGSLVELGLYQSSGGLGADADYQQVTFDSIAAQTFGRHNLIGGIRLNQTTRGDAPDYVQFRAGGFTNLSGFLYNQLVGENFGMVLAGYRYHVAGSGFLPAYLGGTLEYGSVAPEARGVFEEGLLNGSIYFGYRSPIGPMYIGVGAAQGGRQAFFLGIGNAFGSRSIIR
jgi:NTE family protein